MARRRLAVALLLPPPLSLEVDGLRRALGSPNLGLVPAHVTLAPPVNVRDDDVPAALERLRAAASETAPFTLTIGPAATFGDDSGVAYLRVGGDVDALLALRVRVFVAPFARHLDHPYVPHVTLSNRLPPPRQRSTVDAMADFEARWDVTRVHLMAEEHPAWTSLADVPLRPAMVVGRGGLPVELTTGERLDPEAASFAEREWEAFDDEEFGAPWEEREPFAVAARREGDVVGVATGWTQDDALHLSDLVVAATERGTGIGSHLLSAVEALAAERGAVSMTLHAVAGGRAEGFYRARGWSEEARLPGWRMGRDFVRLRRRIFFPR